MDESRRSACSVFSCSCCTDVLKMRRQGALFKLSHLSSSSAVPPMKQAAKGEGADTDVLAAAQRALPVSVVTPYRYPASDAVISTAISFAFLIEAMAVDKLFMKMLLL